MRPEDREQRDENMQIFSVASQRTQWLSARLGVIAGNVANASTPGFRAREVTPFSAVLESSGAAMARTSPVHLNASGSAGGAAIETREAPPARMTHSGNTVSLEKEMMAGAETVRAYRLTAGLVRSWHHMFLMSLRDG